MTADKRKIIIGLLLCSLCGSMRALMITDPEALFQWKLRAAAQPQGRTVLDLEADSLHRHREKLCLIQYADAEGVVIIDPLGLEDMRLFTLWLEQTDVWMHGADYAMSLLPDAFGPLKAGFLGLPNRNGVGIQKIHSKCSLSVIVAVTNRLFSSYWMF